MTLMLASDRRPKRAKPASFGALGTRQAPRIPWDGSGLSQEPNAQPAQPEPAPRSDFALLEMARDFAK
jgi:hypothetical protein